MRYHALGCDYDGTIAWDGEVSESTVLALEDVKKSGRKLILVTGRELDDLIKVFPRLDLFDRRAPVSKMHAARAGPGVLTKQRQSSLFAISVWSYRSSSTRAQ